MILKFLDEDPNEELEEIFSGVLLVIEGGFWWLSLTGILIVIAWRKGASITLSIIAAGGIAWKRGASITLSIIAADGIAWKRGASITQSIIAAGGKFIKGGYRLLSLEIHKRVLFILVNLQRTAYGWCQVVHEFDNSAIF